MVHIEYRTLLRARGLRASLAAVLIGLPQLAHAASPTADDLAEAHRWVAAKLEGISPIRPPDGSSSWAYVPSTPHAWAALGELIFSDSDRGIRLGPLGDLAQGRVEGRFA